MKTKKKRESEPRQPAEGKGMLFRSATIEARAADGDTPAEVRMSVSSEEPVLTYGYLNERWQSFYEILDHSKESVDMSRAKDGLVILDRHYGDQIGLMDVALKDRKLGGAVEFCSGQRAQEISKDAAKGLRRNVSVGYMVRTEDYEIEGEQDGIPVVRAKSWMPYEASFEPVPADTTVGVNRAKKIEAEQDATPEIKKKEERKMDPKEMAKLFARAAVYGIEADNVTELLAADEAGARSALDSLIVEKQGAELKSVRKENVELKERKPDVPKGVAPAPVVGGDVETQAKVMRKFSVLNVLRAAAGIKTDVLGNKVDIGFESEISAECRKLGMGSRNGGGLIIPHAALGQRDFTVSGTSSATVSTDLYSSEFIDLLRTYMVLGKAGVTYLTGLVGDIAIPKMSAGATGYWVSEGSDVGESQPTLGQVTGKPNTCGVLTDISRKLLTQSTPDAEALVRDEIVQRIGRTVQIAVFQGTGADGQPSAITNATGINNPAVTTGTPTYLEMLGFPGSILADSAPADGQKWIGTAEIWQKLAGTVKDSGSGQFVLDADNNMMMGREFLPTEDVGANSLFFGAWSTVVIGMWGAGIDINMDTATLSASGGLRIVGLQDVDVMVRQGKALAYNDAVTS